MALERRERVVIILGALGLLFILGYFVGWRWYRDHRQKRQDAVKKAQDALDQQEVEIAVALRDVPAVAGLRERLRRVNTRLIDKDKSGPALAELVTIVKDLLPESHEKEEQPQAGARRPGGRRPPRVAGTRPLKVEPTPRRVNKGIASVTVTGTMNMGELHEFLKALDGHPKLLKVEEMSINASSHYRRLIALHSRRRAGATEERNEEMEEELAKPVDLHVSVKIVSMTVPLVDD